MIDLKLTVCQMVNCKPQLVNSLGLVVANAQQVKPDYFNDISYACNSYSRLVILLNYFVDRAEDHTRPENYQAQVNEAEEFIKTGTKQGIFQEALEDLKAKWRQAVYEGHTEKSFEQFKGKNL